MTNYHAEDRPPVLDPAEIQKLLSMRLIANLATIDDDGGIHLVPMWFLRVAHDICIPTSRNTHKYDNLRKRPRASVMIDVSRAGLTHSVAARKTMLEKKGVSRKTRRPHMCYRHSRPVRMGGRIPSPTHELVSGLTARATK